MFLLIESQFEGCELYYYLLAGFCLYMKHKTHLLHNGVTIMKAKLLSLFIVLICSSTNIYAKSDTRAAICDGKRALISLYQCDLAPLGGGVNCILFGTDINRSGTWNPGDEFIIIDGNNKAHSATYDKVKSLPKVAQNGYAQCS